MPAYSEHDITLASFAQIDTEMGAHSFTPAEYAVVRRVIHTTADFEFVQLVQFAHDPMTAAANALAKKKTVITDVSMVAAGIRTVMQRTWNCEVVAAVTKAKRETSTTRTASGMQQCLQSFSGAIVAVGNAPTALLSLCDAIERDRYTPALVIGAPVGFINVVESKQRLAALAVPHIVVNGRKGGSAVAAAILNALMIEAWEASE